MARQSCAICAWRETCAKRFAVTDGGSRCPDYSRDIRIREQPETESDNPNEISEKVHPK